MSRAPSVDAAASQGGQVQHGAAQQQCDCCVDYDARPLARRGVVRHGTRGGAVADQQLRPAEAGEAHRGAAHHAAVGGDGVPVVLQPRRFRRGMTVLQPPDDTRSQKTHAAPVFVRPGHQPAGEGADVVPTVHEGLPQLYRLCQVVVHRTVYLARVDVAEAVGVALANVVEPSAFHRQAQQVAHGLSQHDATGPVGQPICRSSDAADYATDVGGTVDDVGVLHGTSYALGLLCRFASILSRDGCSGSSGSRRALFGNCADVMPRQLLVLDCLVLVVPGLACAIIESTVWFSAVEPRRGEDIQPADYHLP